jgi:ApaG protein
MHSEYKISYSSTTQNIKVTVVPEYRHDLSSAEDHLYVWSYDVFIENLSNDPVHLVGRYWQIFDKLGNTQEVKGVGVVGQQPIIKPGEAFKYNSHAQLKTSSGMMSGHYEVINQADHSIYEIAIPTFSLDNPEEKILYN